MLVACEGRTRTIRVPVGPAPEELRRIDAAVAATNGSRAALLDAAGAVPAAATALDAADEACATGTIPLAAATRRTARAAAADVPASLAALRKQVLVYRSALQDLQAAAGPLEDGQRDVLVQVGRAGEAEAAALAVFGESAGRAWPAYAALSQTQAAWLERAQAGWYRSTSEAAGAYVVLRRPRLAELAQARSLLQAADAARRPATEAMRRQLREADAALDALRGPTG